MKQLIIFIFIFSLSFTQESRNESHYTLNIETNSFLYFSQHSNGRYKFFQGENLLFNVGKILSNGKTIGLSSGCFYVQSVDKVYLSKKMNYFYVPLYFFYESRIANSNSYFNLKFGIPTLTFFDSDLTYHNDIVAQQFWPNYSDTKTLNDKSVRNKPWLIISPSFNFSLLKKTKLSSGLSMYFGNHIFFYLNLGLSYQFQ